MKKITTTVLTAGLFLGAFATQVGAQSPPPRQQFGTGELPEFLKPFDINNDNKLSAEERLAYLKALREAKPPFPGSKNPWDTNGDGKLSEEERQAAREAIAQKILAERTKRFDELDTDDDGFLTAAELGAIPRITPEQVAAMVTRLDKDTDGLVSKAEFLAALTPVEPPIPPMPPYMTSPLQFVRFPIPVFPRTIIATFDTDKNGSLSEAELRAARTLLDTDANGMISFIEWRTYVLANLPPTPPPTPPTL